VQAKLAANAVERRIRAKGSPAILAGRIFDDRGNRMSPTHSNKRGVRYRYYVSQPLVQKRQQNAGTVARVPAPEIENLVLGAARGHLKSIGEAEDLVSGTDRDHIERHVERITVKPQAIEVILTEPRDRPARTAEHSKGTDHDGNDGLPLALVLPWAAQSFSAVKGIVHTPSAAPTLKPETRDALLMAIAKARSWIDDLAEHRIASFAEIARREGKVERHIRLLAPLAFVSPKIVSAIIDGTVPADLTVTGLAKALPHSWSEQERRIGLPQI
jgi:site-specific DNA recombinase